MRQTKLLALCLVLLGNCFAASDAEVDALLNAGHAKRAKAIIEPRVKANPNDAYADFLLSRVRLAFEDTPSAIALAEKSISLDPKNADFHTHLAHVYGFLSGNSPVYKQYGYVKQLKKELDAALALNPKQIDALLIRAVFLTVAPSFVGGDRKQADEIVKQMIQLNAEKGYIAQATLAVKTKDWGRAEASYKQALQANPRSYAANYQLGMLYCTMMPAGHCPKAEPYGKELVESAPTRVGGYTLLAQAYAASKRWAELDSVIQQADRQVPDDAAPYFYAAQLLEQTGADLPRAERYIRHYLSQEREGDEPTVYDSHCLLGRTLQKASHPDSSSELQIAARQKPEWEQSCKERRGL